MKRRLLSLLAVFCLVLTLLPGAASAAGITSGSCGPDAHWKFDQSSGTLTITGSGEIASCDGYRGFSDAVKTIVVEEGITGLCDYAFGYDAYGGKNQPFRSLTSVLLPSTLKTIGAGAFYNDENLKEITLPSNLVEIGAEAFSGTGITSFNIPSTVSSIVGNPFPYGVKTITVADNPYYTVVDNVLYKTNSEASWELVCYPAANTRSDFMLPSRVKAIPEFAFFGCKNLTSVTIPSGVTEIPAEAFIWCSNLEKLILPEGLLSFDTSALIGCDSLKRLIVPASVTSFVFFQGLGYGWDGGTYGVNECYFYGSEAPNFAGNAYLGEICNKIVFYYPENATGWDAIISDPDIAEQIERGTMEFNTWVPDVGGEEGESTGLKLVSSSPENGSTSVAVDDSLVLTFNRAIAKNLDFGKGSIRIVREDTGKTVVEISDATTFIAQLGAYINETVLTIPHIFESLAPGRYNLVIDKDVIVASPTDEDRVAPRFAGIEEGEFVFTIPSSEVPSIDPGASGGATGGDLPNIPSTPTSPYSDVSTGAWYYDAVKYVTDKGLMDGVADRTFAPESKLTRGMLVTILYRLEKEPAAGSSAFTDVADGKYYAKAVAWAAANGIVNGETPTTFHPEGNITREQMAAILYRYAAYKKYDTTVRTGLGGYTDAGKISGYADTPMKWANAEKLINGETPTTLVPQGSATRAQVAAILMRFCENVAK